MGGTGWWLSKDTILQQGTFRERAERGVKAKPSVGVDPNYSTFRFWKAFHGLIVRVTIKSRRFASTCRRCEKSRRFASTCRRCVLRTSTTPPPRLCNAEVASSFCILLCHQGSSTGPGSCKRTGCAFLFDRSEGVQDFFFLSAAWRLDRGLRGMQGGA